MHKMTKAIKVGDPIEYKEEVLGEKVSIVFTNESDGKDEFYDGIIIKMQIELSQNQKEMTVEHFIRFEDDEEIWFDLVEEETAGRLKWPRGRPVKKIIPPITTSSSNTTTTKAPKKINKLKHPKRPKIPTTLNNNNHKLIIHDRKRKRRPVLRTRDKNNNDNWQRKSSRLKRTKTDDAPRRRKVIIEDLNHADSDADSLGTLEDDNVVDDIEVDEKEDQGEDILEDSEEDDDDDDDVDLQSDEEDELLSLEDEQEEDAGVIILKPEELAKLSSLVRILQYMDDIEPDIEHGIHDKSYYYYIKDHLGIFAKENPNHLAVKHWVLTKRWKPPSNEALQALMNLIKSMISRWEEKNNKLSYSRKKVSTKRVLYHL